MAGKGKKGKSKKGKKGKKGKKSSIQKNGGENSEGILEGGEISELGRGKVEEGEENQWLMKQLEGKTKTILNYKKHSEELQEKNVRLFREMKETEKDTVEVIGFLRKEGDAKDLQIDYFSKQVKEMKELFSKEKEALIDEFNSQINNLEEQLGDKDTELKFMQAELKVVKEFRKKRTQMQKELDGIKLSMQEMSKRHKETISRMEHTFFEEKIRLQKEANQKVNELASKAHTQAVSNLENTTKTIFQENVRMTEALRYHVEEGRELRKATEILGEQASQLSEEKNLNDQIVKEKILQSKMQSERTKELSEQVQNLESALSLVVIEFQKEREILIMEKNSQVQHLEGEIDHLRRAYEMKCKEANHIKRLGRKILDERTQVEQFLLDSLQFIRQEVLRERRDVEQAEKAAYQESMREILYETQTAVVFPAIRSFQKNHVRSIDDFLGKGGGALRGRDYEEGDAVDFSSLSWEERERILHILFAQMNGVTLAEAVGDSVGDSNLPSLPVSSMGADSASNVSPSGMDPSGREEMLIL